MGEIPDWLIELAENADNEESEEITEQLTEQANVELQPESIDQQTEEIVFDQQPQPTPVSGFLEEPVDLMDELRSQVEPLPEEIHPEDTGTPKRRKRVTFMGMVPWQLAVLSIMLFLNIAIIGLLFLTILGRIAF